MTWKEAIIYTLQQNTKDNEYLPMHFQDITNYIAENKLRDQLNNTPANTVSAQLTTNSELFIKLGEGMYALTETGQNYVIGETSNNTNEQDPELANGDSAQQAATSSQSRMLIKSFGMFWRRDAVRWCSNTKLLGMQSTSSPAIDLSEMRGIYLLYDGREVIYVGQAVRTPIVKRLADHTGDRLATRWDRFSWFSLDAFESEANAVAKTPNDIGTNVNDLCNALEGILIEGMEPRQNRKQGNNFANEYYQVIDPDVQNEQALATLSRHFRR